MKRWHIKSVYPMPYQLKKAAEKKRQTGHRANADQTTATSSTRTDLSPDTIETNELLNQPNYFFNPNIAKKKCV